ncbi:MULTISPECIES: sigma 54-interacting transcriptional regulator [unclassified Clostridioides]|uniref:sigma 54-interacting transcriptional regulator n=1 Tax=unclassified Clostridioides TaxID=2635829 RepID=UPI001D112534|nr:sigma 54-interacting transcriptional regulator [Clostridioides sp. ZZV14-6150]MCC0717027.1 sigma 54-interacting transcriptional regulator [Clostridioides sp. ZZV14-6105]MCC0720910.1 sigma 54-interacting transcriptional regulator [Clostridioides sp. ZZV14-6104]MCC0725759.1 sigma 54-interacting transcriptional regulator [Clostridioides sp. ZZV14-6045]MCC0731561.1 sigma 54-interacting transcriptional regulator [Clostridioides sp. ZZV14-6048]MCC0733380.1 sigma 54-interacting transcriptional reg
MDKILREIQREDKKNPYTDQELAEILNVARSEVIAVRKKNNILDSRERRKQILIKDISKIVNENPQMSERKITEILTENGYNISRSAVSKLLKEENLSQPKAEIKDKELVSSGKHVKVSKAVEEDGFEELIGIKGSLKEKVNLAKSAIMYPPNGLHTIIYGETGVGKSELATCMYKYAVKNNIKEENSPFIVFNCADYAENPNLLIAQLFGVVKGAYTGADANREGLVEQANNGILFLDEIHRLPAAGQEILFSLIDRGEFRRLGESSSNRKANVLIISATTENPDSNLLQTFRRRIPMVINLPNMSERPKSERYEIIIKFFEREAKRVNKNFIITKEVMCALMNYKCTGNIGQLKSDIQVTCARAFSKAIFSSDKVIIDLDSLRDYIKSGYYDCNCEDEKYSEFSVEDIYIDISELVSGKNRILSDNEISEIYNYAEKELKVLESKCFSEEELKNAFIEKLDNKFNAIKNNKNLSDRRSRIDWGGQLKEYTLEIMDKVIVFIKEQFKHVNQGLYLALAIHIEHAIDRIKDGKTIINPSLDKIKASMPMEYELSRYVMGIVEDLTQVTFPEDELGYLAYYINKFCYNEESIKDKVKVVIVTHGKVGIEMSNVVNHILGIECTLGIEIALTDSPSEGIEHVLEELKKIEAQKGILVLIDMGSLVILGDEVEKRLGIRCKTVNRVDTLLAMEAGKLATIEGKSLDGIIADLKKNKNYAMVNTNKFSYRKNEYGKKNVIITLCLSGVGTALNLKEHIEKQIEEYDASIEVKPIAFLNNNLEDELNDIEAEYNIIAICGTIDIDYKNVPFISYNEVLGKNGINKVLEHLNNKQPSLSSDNQLNNLIHEDLILYDFEGISKEYIIDTLVSKLEEGGYVDSKYILSVYKREAMGSVVMASKVAVPHGLPENVIKPAIAIARLNKPIVWDNKFMVDLVVLLALKENNKKEIRSLFSKINDQHTLEVLLNTEDKNEIKKILS